MSTKTDVKYDNREEVMQKSRECLSKEIVEFIEKCMEGPEASSQLIAVLHKVQAKYGYLEKEKMDAVAQLMQIPTSKVAGVATFYHFFSLKPKGKFVINICLGTACYVKGADKVVDKIKQEIGIDIGETTKDGMFTLEASRCIGTCGLAPVMMIGDNVHPQVTPDQVPGIIEKYLKTAKA